MADQIQQKVVNRKIERPNTYLIILTILLSNDIHFNPRPIGMHASIVQSPLGKFNFPSNEFFSAFKLIGNAQTFHSKNTTDSYLNINRLRYCNGSRLCVQVSQ